jgi:hypothetical protein
VKVVCLNSEHTVFTRVKSPSRSKAKKVDDVGCQIPVPDAIVGAPYGKLESLLAFAQLWLQRFRYGIGQVNTLSECLRVRSK